MKKWIIIAIIAGGLGTGAYLLWFNGKNGAAEFRFSKISKGPVISTVSATGVVKPTTLVQVGSQVSGTIKKITVDFNSAVKAGEIICELDKVPLEARVSQDKANLAKAKARIDLVNANLTLAKNELERAEKLAKDDLISKSELDKERAKHKGLEAELKLTEAEVSQAEAALQVSLANLGYATITSPVDGVIISRNVDVGQTVAASFQAPVLFEIAESLENIYILADVSEADIGNVKDKACVNFSVDAYPELNLQGEVMQIRLAPKVTQNVVTYTVVVTAKNQDMKLLPGMTANMRFVIDRSPKDSLRVSNSALRFIPDAKWIGSDVSKPKDEKSAKVWIYSEGKLKAVLIEPGITDGRFTHIAKGDLPENQQVVVGIKLHGQEDEDLKSPFQNRFGPRPRRQ